MTIKQQSFQNTANSLIKKLEKRNMEGYFVESSKELVPLVLSMMNPNTSVSFGGSETLKETGMLNALQTGNFTIIDRTKAVTDEERRETYAKSVMSDYFFMSSNAVTLNGELVNIDGNGNRVSCLIHGPKYVYIIVGMNKIVSDVESAISRVQNIATPPNGVRLNRQTPCAKVGHCENCLAPDCMCNQIVITRRSCHTGRIKVFFVAEELGY